MRQPSLHENEVFEGLCGAVSREALASLRAAVNPHLGELAQAARQNEFLATDLAEELAHKALSSRKPRFVEEDVRHLYVRRFKKDVEGQAGSSLQDRQIHLHKDDASPAEEAALAELHGLAPHNLGRKRNGVDHLPRSKQD